MEHKKALIKNLCEMFIRTLQYFNETDFKVMDKTFTDMRYAKVLGNKGIKIENIDDKIKYFAQFATLLSDSESFDFSFISSTLIETIAIERTIIHSRVEYTNKND